MHVALKLGLAAALCSAAGCVPITDYRALERRFTEQDEYIAKHKGDVRELERREQVLTIRAREQERQLELTRARLKKSETLRERLQQQEPQVTVPASVAREPEPEPMPVQVAGFEVNPETHGLVIDSEVLFAPGKATLTPKGKGMIDKLVAELKKSDYAGKRVRLEGHTDDQPIKRSGHESNWELSAKRALAVLHQLEEHGIPGSRLCFAGYGPYKPFKSGKDEASRKQNRRVEVLLVD